MVAEARVGSRSPRPTSPGVTPRLLAWFRAHRRDLPWRRDRSPYRIWVAEVLLQQTRVEQAAPYFERFVRAFPTARALAAAPLGDVLKAWQGAGYYARARHLHRAARELVAHRNGELPRTVAELEELPGVGPYVARAIASLAYGTPVVAIEANGLRVAARWTREEGDVRARAVRARLAAGLEAALPADDAGAFNEAVMELGETVCRPAAPRCGDCPVRSFCRAYRETDDPGRLPRRPAPRVRPHVRGAVVALRERGRWLVQRRAPTGLLGGLWEFPGGKIEAGERPRDAAVRELAEETGRRPGPLVYRGVVRHGYSHFTVELHVFEGAPAVSAPRSRRTGQRWVTLGELGRLPIPKGTEKIARLLAEARPGRASRGSGSRRGRTRA
ncbi:MAG: A/G-specific adenine glycosylase [Thermoplasmata archaeon]